VKQPDQMKCETGLFHKNKNDADLGGKTANTANWC